MQNHDIRLLNDLVATTIDNADRYAEAAREARDSQLAVPLQACAAERREVASRLRQQVSALGGEPEDDGTLAGTAQRVAMHLRDRLGSGGDEAVLAAAEKAQRSIEAAFEDAIKDNGITPDTQAVLTESYRRIRAGAAPWRHGGPGRSDA